MDYVRENEWAKVLKTFCAMCEGYEQSPKDMMQQTTPKDKLSVTGDKLSRAGRKNENDEYAWLMQL